MLSFKRQSSKLWNLTNLKDLTNKMNWQILRLTMTVTSSEAFNAEQSQIYILPVSASTSDIQGINIKLINENLGDKIMFFSDDTKIFTPHKKWTNISLTCTVDLCKILQSMQKGAWLLRDLIFPSSFNRLYLQTCIEQD